MEASATYERIPFRLGPGDPVRIMAPTSASPSRKQFDMHYELELGVVLKGKVRRFVGPDRHWDIGVGEPWFCGIWEPHGVQILSAPCEVLAVAIWPPLLMDLYRDTAPDVNWLAPFSGPPGADLRIPHGVRSDLTQKAKAVRKLQRPGTAHDALRRRWAVLDLLLFIIETTGVDGMVPTTVPVEPIVPAIELAFAAQRLVTNEEAASACGVSVDIFMRRFRELMGLSFSKFALRHRLSRSAHALVEDNAPLLTVAHDWGFTDESHLNRLFHRHYGCTPGEYRRQQRETT